MLQPFFLAPPQSLLIQLGVKEVLIPAEEKTIDPEAQKLRKLIERCGIVFTEKKRSESRQECSSGSLLSSY
jgi:hypothetical protein